MSHKIDNAMKQMCGNRKREEDRAVKREIVENRGIASSMLRPVASMACSISF